MGEMRDEKKLQTDKCRWSLRRMVRSTQSCVEITSLTPPGFTTSSDHFTTSMGFVHFFILDLTLDTSQFSIVG
ncbi:hypothetical protein SRHO_G00320420 [Serrasalmus rhombeus]